MKRSLGIARRRKDVCHRKQNDKTGNRRYKDWIRKGNGTHKSNDLSFHEDPHGCMEALHVARHREFQVILSLFPLYIERDQPSSQHTRDNQRTHRLETRLQCTTALHVVSDAARAMGEGVVQAETVQRGFGRLGIVGRLWRRAGHDSERGILEV